MLTRKQCTGLYEYLHSKSDPELIRYVKTEFRMGHYDEAYAGVRLAERRGMVRQYNCPMDRMFDNEGETDMNTELMTQLERHLLKIKADPSFRDSQEHREFVLSNAHDLLAIPRDQIRDLFGKVGLKVLWI